MPTVVLRQVPAYVFVVTTADSRETVMKALREAIDPAMGGLEAFEAPNALVGEVLANSFWARPVRTWGGGFRSQHTILGVVNEAVGETRVQVTVRPPLFPLVILLVLGIIVFGAGGFTLGALLPVAAVSAIALGVVTLGHIREGKRICGIIEDAVYGTSWLSR